MLSIPLYMIVMYVNRWKTKQEECQFFRNRGNASISWKNTIINLPSLTRATNAWAIKQKWGGISLQLETKNLFFWFWLWSIVNNTKIDLLLGLEVGVEEGGNVIPHGLRKKETICNCLLCLFSMCDQVFRCFDWRSLLIPINDERVLN